MINVAKALREIAASPGDVIVFTKDHATAMLAEVEIGQRARIALTNIKTQVAVAASSAGIAA